MSQLVMGHTVNGKPYEFPHLCPGEDCAIARWIFEHSLRLTVDWRAAKRSWSLQQQEQEAR